MSAAGEWNGFAPNGIDNSNATSDYERALASPGLAGVLSIAGRPGQALVLRNQPTACYLKQHRMFVHWVGADSEEELRLSSRRDYPAGMSAEFGRPTAMPCSSTPLSQAPTLSPKMPIIADGQPRQRLKSQRASALSDLVSGPCLIATFVVMGMTEPWLWFRR
jgi:hypothetical protein